MPRVLTLQNIWSQFRFDVAKLKLASQPLLKCISRKNLLDRVGYKGGALREAPSRLTTILLGPIVVTISQEAFLPRWPSFDKRIPEENAEEKRKKTGRKST